MFTIDVLSRTPVYEQLVRQLESFLLSGILRPGDQLPSVRSVSLAHSINPRTILHAYTELDHRGLITAVPGKGYFVRPDAKDNLKSHHHARLDELREILSEMALAGVAKETVLSALEEAYSNAETQTRKE